MKLHRLELEGFGPFRERQVVDFDAFQGDGIFLIAGRTGAGKSSVLDGVCFALYGGVPRYDSGDKRLRSDHCGPDDRTEVSLEFTAAGRRWKVTRSPEYERPKKHGGGLTTQAPQASLEVHADGVWTGVAARPRDVAAELDEIVGLTQQQFLQVILLAQNRFARFLLARNDERQAVLRTLFGTRTYAQYESILDDRRKDAQRALEQGGETARLLLDEAERTARSAALLDEQPEGDPAPDASAAGSPRGRLDALVRTVERAAYRVEASLQQRTAAETALDDVQARERTAAALHERQVRRLDTRRALEALDARRGEIDADRARGERAQAAEVLRPALDAADRAAIAGRAAAETAETAGAAWLAAGESASTADDLRARDDELSATIAQTTDAVDAEAQLAAAAAEHAQAAAEAAAAEQAVADLDAQRAAVPEALRALDERVAALSGAAPARDAARVRLDDLRGRREAAREAEALAGPLASAERAVVSAADAVGATAAAHGELLRRRLDAAAGDLARGLVDGEECPVCGALEHPRPAHPTDEPVTDAAIDAAVQAKDDAIDAGRVADAAAREARAAHAAAAARAGGDDVGTLDALVAVAVATLAAAGADVEEHERASVERAELARVDAEAAAGRETLVAAAAGHRQTAALAGQRAATLRARVEDARGAFASVADRLADARDRRRALQAFRDATAQSALLAQVLADARADRDERVGASPFSDADAAAAALLPAAERAALDDRVREHDAARRARTQTLLELELELVDTPDEPVDLVPLATEAAEARRVLTEAVAAHATAAEVAARLRDLAHRADDAHRGIAAAADEAAVLARLADTVAGRAPNTHRMTLETFVLAAELEEIVARANERLDEMSAGRYRLQHTDALAARGAASGLGLAVMDAFTGQARPPQSLSGGETFLASLALALGLAQVVTDRAGGIRLDTLFIDEGFGSLDDDTLDLAMRALDELRQGGRTVGVISHVAAMREQIPAQLAVEITPQGPSTIRQAAALPV